MKNYAYVGLTLLTSVLLSACSSTGTEAPSLKPLSELTPEKEVVVNWDSKLVSSDVELDVSLSPVIRDDALYVADTDGRVLKANKASGATIWRHDLEKGIQGGVTVDKEAVYVATTDGNLVALDEETGNELWRTKLTSQALAPVASNDYVVVAHTLDGNVLAFDAETGARKWTNYGNPQVLSLRGSSQPVIEQNLVFVGQSNGRIKVLSLENGNETWQHAVSVPRGRSELDRLADINGKVLLDSGKLFAVSFQGKIIAVDLRNGKTLWSKPMSSYRSLASDDRSVYVSAADGTVWALDKQTGQTMWQQDALENRGLSSPQVYDNNLVVADKQGYVHFLAKEDGHLQARVRPTGSPITVQPIVDDNTLYVMSQTGRVAALTLTEKG